MNELSNEKTMTIKEVSEALGVSIRVCQDNIKTLFPEIVNHGRTTYLNEVQVTKLKLVLEKHHNLTNCEGTFTVKTNLEKQLLIQQAMNLQNEMIRELTTENDKLEIANKILQPKAFEYDRFLSSASAYLMRDVAKIIGLGIGSNKIYSILVSYHIIYKKDKDYRPYQRYVKYFKLKPTTYIDSTNGEAHTTSTILVLPTGISFIHKMVSKYIGESK